MDLISLTIHAVGAPVYNNNNNNIIPNQGKTARPGLDTVKGPLREHTATFQSWSMVFLTPTTHKGFPPW